MKKKGLLALLLTFIMLFSSVGAVLAADEGGVGTPVWTVEDFTYDEAGTTVTGLTNIGKEKITVNSEITIPEVGPTEQAITAIGDGINMQGIFVYKAGTETTEDTTDDKIYTPSSVVLPSTLTKIGKWAFALNPSLTYEAEMTSITFPEGLVEIGQTAFQNSKLTSVSIPDSVTTMGTGAFTGSSRLTNIKLSKNVTAIPQSAFTSGNDRTENLKTLVIPEGVTSIGRSAFAGTRMERIVLPSTLEIIDQQSLENHQLTEVTIPGSVKTIGKNAFRMNLESLVPMLTKVTLNEGLETIGQYAFDGNPITELRLPSTVVLSAKDKATDLIFGTASAPANPIVKVMVCDESKVEAFNTEYANNYSHIVVYEPWVKDEKGYRYQNADGSFTKNAWQDIDNERYYFDAEGYRVTDWLLDKNTWYYMDENGVMQTGWLLDGKTWYYLDANGAMQTGWEYVDNTWYYLNASGAMQTGWLLDGATWYYLNVSGAMQTEWVFYNGAWYYLNASGAMQTGWVLDGNTWYYLNASGAMQTGWLLDGNTWYYLNASGAMQTGWLLDGNTWYYLDASGAMQTGWVYVGNAWYYLKSNGAMAANRWIGRYYVGADGAWVQ